MLIVENKEHYEKVIAFAKKVGLYEDTGNKNNALANRLAYLENYGGRTDGVDRMRVRLLKDCAPYSFYFLIEQRAAGDSWSHLFSGGLLYHGPHDGNGSGAGPTFAVLVDSSSSPGWSLHT